MTFYYYNKGCLLQVNLCQKLFFLHQSTQNMTTDCGLVDARISASERDLPVLKDQEGKDRRSQLLCYVSLIRACNKVL